MGKTPARILISFILLAIMACAHPISKGMRETLDPGISTGGLFASTDQYVGKRVMLGGSIVETRNFPAKSEIEVVQKEVDSSGRVSSNDATLGRFIFRRQGYLESEIYAKGREVIGVGKVVGNQTGKIGDREYLFPVVEVEELHLMEVYREVPYYYDPFYPYYYDPFYHPFHRRHYYHPYY
jgi:outer membrane lipoprotein